MRSSYPFGEHLACLLPAAFMLCGMHLFFGTEEEVFRHFTVVRMNSPAFTPLMEAFTHGALYMFYPVYAFILVRGLRGRKIDEFLFVLCYITAQIVISALLCRIVKIAVGRPRPMTGGAFMPFSLGWGYQSFPSGHTAEITGSCLPFLWRNPGTRYIPAMGFGLLIAAVAFSRVYLGMHHLTDIWGGLVFGSVSGYASWAFYNFLQARWREMLPETITAWIQSGNKELRS